MNTFLAARVNDVGDKRKGIKSQRGQLCIGLATRLNRSKECLNYFLNETVPSISPRVIVKLVLELVIQCDIQVT